MRELEKSVKLFRQLAQEVLALNSMEEDSKQMLTEATAEGRLDDLKVQRKITQARIQLDIVESRHGHVENALRETLQRMRTLLDAERRAFNERVTARRAQLVESVKESLRPQFEGDERHLADTVEKLLPTLPNVRECDRGFYELPFMAKIKPEDVLDYATDFLRHARRTAKRFGWTLDTEAETQD